MAVDVRVAGAGSCRRVRRRALQVLVTHRQGVDLIDRGRDVRANELSRGLRSAFVGEIEEPIVRRRGDVAADTPIGAERGVAGGELAPLLTESETPSCASCSIVRNIPESGGPIT